MGTKVTGNVKMGGPLSGWTLGGDWHFKFPIGTIVLFVKLL